ncbi:MAG: hydroxyacid dehydrogenase [Patescibacteria group bacterium]|nr:hydroxyacid dehydrogenase [Patescibacteria group bacterium]
MVIGFFELEGWEKDEIKEHLTKDELTFSSEKITPEHLPERRDCEVISIFVNSRITPAVLDAFPNLKYITTRSTGFDHIDLAECKKRGITVSYVPGYGNNTVAEFAFGLLLSLTRNLYPAIDEIKQSGSYDLSHLRGMDLAGKTLGVIGTGRIGQKAIKIAKGLEMNVIAADPYPNNAAAEELGYTYVPLDMLLAKSDAVTIHCLYTPDTHHLLDKENIPLMKKGAYLVNTARGAIIETEALVAALKNGTLAGAALDVLEAEPETKHPASADAAITDPETKKLVALNRDMMQMPNVLITPHTAFNTAEAVRRILDKTLESIDAFTAGKPINLVL